MSGITTGGYTARCCLSVLYGVLCNVWRLYLPCNVLDGSRRDTRRTREQKTATDQETPCWECLDGSRPSN